jgi:hypothetical protein
MGLMTSDSLVNHLALTLRSRTQERPPPWQVCCLSCFGMSCSSCDHLHSIGRSLSFAPVELRSHCRDVMTLQALRFDFRSFRALVLFNIQSSR